MKRVENMTYCINIPLASRATERTDIVPLPQGKQISRMLEYQGMMSRVHGRDYIQHMWRYPGIKPKGPLWNSESHSVDPD